LPTYRIAETEAGARADLALAAAAGIPRAQARRWIDEGVVKLNAGACRPGQRLRVGDTLETTPPAPVSIGLEAEAIPLAVLYEDADLIVIDKPAGLVVHPAPGHARGTLVNALLHHCRDLEGIGGELRPGIVHRLDKGTSGVMVVAKHDAALASLASQFKQHSITRIYRALVRGAPTAAGGRVAGAIGRHPRDRKRMSLVTSRGRDAATNWSVLQRFSKSGCAWLEIRPETGRTHQIRVHLASAGLPIVGDPVYGRAREAGLPLDRPALHAAVLGFTHPRSGERLQFEAPVPPDLAAALALLARREGGT
jgi:23S rRNA pseudouridine1911/1915/1917 synthase